MLCSSFSQGSAMSGFGVLEAGITEGGRWKERVCIWRNLQSFCWKFVPRHRIASPGLSIYPTLTPNHNPNTNRPILTTDPNRFVRGAESALFKHRGRYNKKARHPALFLVAKIFQPFPSVAAGKKKTFWEEAKKPLQSSMALEVIHWNSVKHADCCALNNLQET
jgi:hypothetical protein